MSRIEEELEAPRHADGFGALDARHAGAQGAVPDVPIHQRARFEVENFGRLFAGANLRIAVSGPPPRAVQNDGIGRHGIHRRHGARAQEAPVEIAQRQLFDRLAIDRRDARRHRERHLRRLLHARLPADELAERRPLVGRDIEQEHVGHARRRGAANLVHQRVLHQEHGEREHDADAERDHRRLRLIPRPVEIRHTVPHHAGKARARAAQEPAEAAQHGPPGERKQCQANSQRQREVAAGAQRVGETALRQRPRHHAGAQQDCDPHQESRRRATPPRATLHIPPENQRRTNIANRQQRRQGEQ